MKSFILILLLLLLTFPNIAYSQGGLTDLQIENIARSVVMIGAFEGEDLVSIGSGTLINASGTIYTNAHVIQEGSKFGIFMLDDINDPPVLRYHAIIYAQYEEMDFAILQINSDADGNIIQPGTLNLPFINIAKQIGVPSRGNEIYTFGYPVIGEGYFVLSSGSITTIQNGTICGERMPVWYQTDAEIAPGNSGGLAVDEFGLPLGIPTTVQSESNTGGRLGGILPFDAVLRLTECGTPVVGGGENNPNAGSGSETTNTNLGAENIQMTCDTGEEITNGTEITVVQMRPGFTYRATVLGIDDFDPVLMVINPDRQSGFCNNNSDAAARYSVTIPEIGTITGRSTDAQVRFTQNQGGMADMGLVIGGNNGASGNFVVVLEGMAATSSDGSGDPFAVRITQSMVASGTPLIVYMIGNGRSLDPLMGVVNSDITEYITDGEDNPLRCDDAGNPEYCWGESNSLVGFNLSGPSGLNLNGDAQDAMLMVSPRSAANGNFEHLLFLMTSYNNETQGDYTLIFIMGVK